MAFEKGSVHPFLIAMIEKWGHSLDSDSQAATVLTDLLQAFDCIDHELLIAKLNAYGFDDSILTFIYSCIFERRQRAKINSPLSC